VRIHDVVSQAAHSQETSICDTDYSRAIQGIGQQIGQQITAGCLPAPVANPDRPDCVVEDVTTDLMTGRQSIHEIPWCGPATTPHTTIPCWELTENPKCAAIGNPSKINPDGTCPLEQFGVRIDRGPGGLLPANTSARAECSTIAHSARACATPSPSPSP
jgi:hypothetical protein